MAGRKLRANHRSLGACNIIVSLLRSRLSSSVRCCIFLIVMMTATFLIFYEARYNLFHVRTVAGDNLRQTPWHLFPLPVPRFWGRVARLPKIVQCNYFSCLTHSLKQSAIQSNDTHSCPDFFRWIHEDLTPWRRSKISVESLNAAQKHAAFRVVIVGGRLYTEFYYACVLPRAMFTLWGILQLLDKYPGMVPDVDLMFDCMDRPAIMRADYKDNGPPPPLFRYCGNKDAFDIPFPDWSFWGWPQVDLLPWTQELEQIYKASKYFKWEERRPTAYWKGNPDVGSAVREDLLKCNSSDWGAEIFRQDWWAEVMSGFMSSKLSQQCKHRFKIYTEGHAWSVSFKYILACDSPVLVASPTYYDFFTRGLISGIHYWPLRRDDLCPSIKFAVDWGNRHFTKAKAIGKAGQTFMWMNLKIDHVYDYMFHLLKEYSKLQKFQPVVPSNAHVLCKNAILCFIDDPKSKDFLELSEVQVSRVPPCGMPPRDHDFILDLEKIQQNNTVKIWSWEDIARRQSKV